MVKKIILASLLSVCVLFGQPSPGQQTVYFPVVTATHTAGGLITNIPSYLSLGQTNHELITTLVNFNAGTCAADGANALDFFIRLEGSFDQTTWIALGGMVFDHADNTAITGSSTFTKFFQGSYPFLRVNIVSGNQTAHCAFTIKYIGSFSNSINNLQVRNYNYNLTTRTIQNAVEGNNLAGVSFLPVFSQVNGVTNIPFPVTLSLFGLKINNASTGSEQVIFGVCDRNGAGTPTLNTAYKLLAGAGALGMFIAAGTTVDLQFTPLAPYLNAPNYVAALTPATQVGWCISYGGTTPNHELTWTISYENN